MSGYAPQISARAASLRPSGIRRFFDLLEERRDAISLGIGEPDFLTPWHIRDSGIYSLEKGFTKYTPNAGISALRAECARYMERRFGLSYDPAGEILVTVGGSEALDLCVRATVNPGDEVLIPQPSFVAYGPVVALAGGVPVPLAMSEGNGFKLTPSLLASALTPRARVLVLPYPCNPTGAILKKDDLPALAGVLARSNILVLSDEIYAELTYGCRHASIAGEPGMKERTVVVGGLSKSHSMTGWRMGFAYGPRELIAQMTKIHQYAIMSAPTTSQYAALTALRDGDTFVESMRESYNGRRRYMLDGLRAAGFSCFEPRGAFYLFPSIRAYGIGSEEFCEKLLLSQNVAVIPGNAFGESGEGFIRICYAVSVENLKESLIRIERFVRQL
ncbi:MAG: aminotransferase class I/II-fold pyridoxal phosphate-dependent enzyme [Oscillospiraceae bacterium]|nr:aminotransferase class I/II-fold pyridoxal phosphate-dependent enzyme [Oscillospiraceae bacterium]